MPKANDPSIGFIAKFTGRKLEIRPVPWGQRPGKVVADAACASKADAPGVAHVLGYSLAGTWDGTVIDAWPRR